MLKKHENDHTAIYTDSITAISWVKNKKAKTIQSEKAKLLELIAQKKDESLTGLSIEELERLYADLDLTIK